MRPSLIPSTQSVGSIHRDLKCPPREHASFSRNRHFVPAVPTWMVVTQRYVSQRTCTAHLMLERVVECAELRLTTGPLTFAGCKNSFRYVALRDIPQAMQTGLCGEEKDIGIQDGLEQASTMMLHEQGRVHVDFN